MMRHKRNLWGILYGVCLALFTAFISLDTFVLARVYEPAASATAESGAAAESDSAADAGGTADAGGAAESDSAADAGGAAESGGTAGADTAAPAAGAEILSQDTYSSDGTSITLTAYRVGDTTVYAAAVKADDPSVLKTALAEGSYGKNIKEKTSAMAEENDAVLAVNGDFYGARETGYVIRNGVLYRDTAGKNNEDLVIYKDGSFGIIKESEVSAEELLQNGAVQVFSFGPALVESGEIAVTEDEEVGKAMASNPRTAVGITRDGTWLFVVSDGRTDESAGLSLRVLASFLKDLGAETAYNLDGGGSSTMVFRGEIVNKPTTDGKRIRERSVSDIVYIASES